MSMRFLLKILIISKGMFAFAIDPLINENIHTAAQSWLETGYLTDSVLKDFLNEDKCNATSKNTYACFNGLKNAVAAIDSNWTLKWPAWEIEPSTKIIFQSGTILIVETKETKVAIFNSKQKSFELKMKTLLDEKKYWSSAKLKQTDLENLSSFLTKSCFDTPLKNALFASEFMNGYKSSYDPFASLIPIELETKNRTQTSKPSMRWGIDVNYIENKLIVTDIDLDSNAFWAGFKQFDQILKINGIAIEDMTQGELSELLTASHVSFEILRNNNIMNLALNNIKVLRKPKFESSIISWKGANTLRITLRSFSGDLALCKNISQTIADSKKQTNIQGIILDLRDNSGGYIDFAVCINTLFLGNSIKIMTKKFLDASTPDEETLTHNRFYSFWNKLEIDDKTPLAVLINGNSASASEVTAGAIRDYARGWLIGQKTFGKGSVNGASSFIKNDKILEFNTIAVFYQPGGTSNELVGIIPDFTVPLRIGATSEEEFVIRNQDENIDLPFKNNEAVSPPRPLLAAKIKNCINYTFMNEKNSKLQGGSVVPDYQLWYGLEVLRCNSLENLN